VPLENTYNGHLVADAPAFREILDKLAADPSYRALVMTTPVLSHAPYHMRNWDAFLQSHPEAAHGLDLDEARDLAELYRENHHLLTWNFEAGAEMLSLSGKRLQEFTQAVGVLYASNINLIDRIFGEIVSAIDERGLEDESLVAFTADHGEVMYRENAPFKWSHGLQLAPEALNVPLLIRAPGVGGQNYQAVTRSMDVFPTLAGLAGVPIGAEHGVQGRDLSVALRSGSTAPHLLAPSHTAVLVESVYKQMYQPRWELAWAIARGFFPRIDVNLIWVSIRDGDMVYKHQKITPEEWEHQVFDLARDPGESVNLFDPADSQHSAMVIALADYKARLVEQHRLDDPEGGTQLPADKEAEMLRSLGYIR
jgi:arylsulfatase A-like enzyme